MRLCVASTYLSAACEDESPRYACTSATWAPRWARRVAPVALRSWQLIGRPTALRASLQPPERSRNRVGCNQSPDGPGNTRSRSEETTSELQSLTRISYAVFCLKNNTIHQEENN